MRPDKMITGYSNLYHSYLFFRAIMDYPRNDETRLERFLQLGLLSIIAKMREAGKVVTLQSLYAYAKDAAAFLPDIVAALLARGLIVERAGSSGEGNPVLALSEAMQAAMTRSPSIRTAH